MVARGQHGFDRRIAIDNGAREAVPAIVASPCSVDGVAVALSIAGRHGWPISVKGGGHSAAGFCLVEGGVTIDMHRLDTITISPDGDRMWAGAGVRWHDAYAALAADDGSATLVGGACADVGVAGFLLGGGYSFLSRNLVSAATRCCRWRWFWQTARRSWPPNATIPTCSGRAGAAGEAISAWRPDSNSLLSGPTMRSWRLSNAPLRRMRSRPCWHTIMAGRSP